MEYILFCTQFLFVLELISMFTEFHFDVPIVFYTFVKSLKYKLTNQLKVFSFSRLRNPIFYI